MLFRKDKCPLCHNTLLESISELSLDRAISQSVAFRIVWPLFQIVLYHAFGISHCILFYGGNLLFPMLNSRRLLLILRHLYVNRLSSCDAC